MLRHTLILVLIAATCSVQAQNWRNIEAKVIASFEAGDYEGAIEASESLLRQLQLETPRKDTNYANALANMALSYFYLQEYDECPEIAREEYYLRGYLTPGTPRYYTCAHTLAVYYSYAGQYSECVPLLEEHMRYIVKTYGKDNPTYLFYAQELASVNEAAGSSVAAEWYYTESHRVVKELYNETDSAYAATSNALSTFYLTHGFFEKAEPLFLTAVKAVKEAFGENTQQYLDTYNSLGEFYIYAGWYQQAKETYEGYSEFVKGLVGERSAYYATAINNLAVALEKLGLYEEAEKVYLKVLKIKEKLHGKESATYALSAGNMAVVYDLMGNYERARELQEQTLEIYGKVYGDTSYDYAVALANLSSVYLTNGDNKKALEVAQTALKIHTDLGHSSGSGYTTAMGQLVRVHKAMAQYRKADSLLTKLLDVVEKTQSKTHPDYINLLETRAYMLHEMGDLTGGIKLAEETLELVSQTSGTKSEAYASTMLGLAGMQAQHGELETAEKKVRKALAIQESGRGDMNPSLVYGLSLLGDIQTKLGGFSEAEQAYKRALDIQTQSTGRHHINSIDILRGLAQVYSSMGRYELVEQYQLESYRIAAEFLDTSSLSYLNVLNDVAVMYMNLGQSDKAEPIILGALKGKQAILEPNHPEIATALNNTGAVYLSRAQQATFKEHRQEYSRWALDYFKRALAIDSLVLPEDHIGFAAHFNNIGEAYRMLDDSANAIDYLNRSIDLEIKLYGEDYRGLATSYQNIGLLYDKFGDYKEALKSLNKSLKIKKRVYGEESNTFADTYRAVGSVYEELGNLEKAKEHYAAAMRSSVGLLEANFQFMSEKERRANMLDYKEISSVYNTFAFKAQEEYPEMVGDIYNNELLMKGLLLRSSSRLRDRVLKQRNKTTTQLYNDWLTARKEIARSKGDQEKGPDGFSHMDTLLAQANSLEKKLVAALPDKSLFDAGSWEDLQKRLAPGEAAIEFIGFIEIDSAGAGEWVLAALVLRQDHKHPVLKRLCNMQGIWEVLEASSGSDLSRVTSIYGTLQKPNKALYDLIWRPMNPALEGVNTVYFTPVGVLHKIPFSALHSGDSYLFQEYQLRQLNSTAGLLNRRSEKKMGSKALVLGGVDYEDIDTPEAWQYLSGSKEEADNVTAILKKGKADVEEFTGLLASEQMFKEHSGENAPDIIHVATHGFFYPDPSEADLVVEEDSDLEFRGRGKAHDAFVVNPDPLMRSGIALAGANKAWVSGDSTGDDGVLTAYEVSLMDLRNTELVVLSACETGLGEISLGEGVYGLQRAFKLAGVRFQVMSLWKVPDKETAEFMTYFYGQLNKSKDVRQAFSSTQEMMRQKYDPYFWAAFILVE